jgi:ferredoxin
MLYIDPEHCIDCDACARECPVDAIYQDIHVPVAWGHYIAMNAERSAALIASGEGHILDRKEPKEGPGCKKRR